MSPSNQFRLVALAAMSVVLLVVVALVAIANLNPVPAAPPTPSPPPPPPLPTETPIWSVGVKVILVYPDGLDLAEHLKRFGCAADDPEIGVVFWRRTEPSVDLVEQRITYGDNEYGFATRAGSSGQILLRGLCGFPDISLDESPDGRALSNITEPREVKIMLEALPTPT